MFEWDENKNLLNLEKHGISFEVAIEVFNDKNAYENNRVVGGEVRVKFVGEIDEIILSVVYTIRKNKQRIISARPASKTERRVYYENKK
jgi:uncharacterized DUF497 family protein